MPDAHARDLNEDDLRLAAAALNLDGDASNSQIAEEAIRRLADAERDRREINEVVLLDVHDEAIDDLSDAVADGVDDALNGSRDEPDARQVDEDMIARGVVQGVQTLLDEYPGLFGRTE